MYISTVCLSACCDAVGDGIAYQTSIFFLKSSKHYSDLVTAFHFCIGVYQLHFLFFSFFFFSFLVLFVCWRVAFFNGELLKLEDRDTVAVTCSVKNCEVRDQSTFVFDHPALSQMWSDQNALNSAKEQISVRLYVMSSVDLQSCRPMYVAYCVLTLSLFGNDVILPDLY